MYPEHIAGARGLDSVRSGQLLGKWIGSGRTEASRRNRTERTFVEQFNGESDQRPPELDPRVLGCVGKLVRRNSRDSYSAGTIGISRIRIDRGMHSWFPVCPVVHLPRFIPLSARPLGHLVLAVIGTGLWKSTECLIGGLPVRSVDGNWY